jgi:hypothetical protein
VVVNVFVVKQWRQDTQKRGSADASTQNLGLNLGAQFDLNAQPIVCDMMPLLLLQEQLRRPQPTHRWAGGPAFDAAVLLLLGAL